MSQPAAPASSPPVRVSPWFVLVVSLFITALITANIVVIKLASFGIAVLPAGVVVFPMSYIIGDVLTEVYGYRMARAVIWLGFLCNAMLVFFIWVGQVLPAAPGWDGQAAYQRILGATPRILGASFAGYLVGEFTNSIILARMKLLTRGRWLWGRTITSTIVGEGLDSLVFISLAMGGTIPGDLLGRMIVNQWLAKVAFETLATPLTYGVVGFLKRREGVDVYDYHTSFNPFAIFGRLWPRAQPAR